ncbi:receptor-type guanylate cyclase Gyc76C [Trichonephila clavata]|uniref:Receptor-type guanylate cyclase Gyc76C n=1 Tax=Trichonephila clavata TaxID=2740835 RepID=A0A8X6G3U1_TRICU|nr:receptor-type guanylate cyclase Gyc76C [Trichonephila clavata]
MDSLCYYNTNNEVIPVFLKLSGKSQTSFKELFISRNISSLQKSFGAQKVIGSVEQTIGISPRKAFAKRDFCHFQKCADSADKDDIANKDYKDHFARTYPPNTKVTSSVYELLRYYKWYKFSIIYDDSELYDAVYRSLERGLREPFVINHRASFRNTRICCLETERCCDDPFVKIVQNTSASSRIYVFLGDKTDLGKLLTAFQVRGLLATGNYMVVYVDIESYTEEMAHLYFRLHDGGSEAVMMSAQSLLILVSTPPRGDKYEEFQEKVREYNSEEPFFFKASEIFTEYVPHITQYAAYLYDAVILYAEALEKALKDSIDPRNGKEIMRIFRERSQYTSVTGAIMRIDKDGGAEGNYTVLSWQPTPDNLKLKMKSGVPPPRYCMLPVGRFYAIDNQELRFKLDKEILWVNRDKPPVDEPPCGFDGSGCTATPDGMKKIASSVLGVVLLIIILTVFIIYRNWKYEQEIDGLLWRIDLEDIQRCGQEGTCLVHSASKMGYDRDLSGDISIPLKLSVWSLATADVKFLGQLSSIVAFLYHLVLYHY